jgi:formylglycine-generating enzyme required for sulfatase activity
MTFALARMLKGCVLSFAFWSNLAVSDPAMVLVPGGEYPPFLLDEAAKDADAALMPTQAVEAFYMDAFPVSNGDFRRFLAANPQWQKGKVPEIFADKKYLGHWSDKRASAPDSSAAPVVEVSWFAARAYCEWRGATLPSIDQWEYAAFNRGKDASKIFDTMIEWFSKPNTDNLPLTPKMEKNSFGIAGLYGVIWEWTSDFNSFMSSEDGRQRGDSEMFCGGGSNFATDKEDYPRFMRYAFRSSIKASYSTRNLGFRCVRSLK